MAAASGLHASMVECSVTIVGAATLAYEEFKREHLDTQRLCQEDGVTFIPLITEAGGVGWGPGAHRVFHELAELTSSATGESASVGATNILESLGTIQNASHSLPGLVTGQALVKQLLALFRMRWQPAQIYALFAQLICF